MESGIRAPELSVIVTVVDGGAALRRCLDALTAQSDPPAMEVLVPYDHMSRETGALADRYPDFRFIDLGEILGGLRPRNAFDEHSFYDARRAGALREARGQLLAILEDRGAPRADWAAAMAALHRDSGLAAVGGAIEIGAAGLLNFAAFICDFGRFQPPLSDDDPEYLSDTNICYRREALEGVRHLWAERYEEAAVNWALRRQGAKMRLSDRPRTIQAREPMSMPRMAMERLHWGRVFGRMRGREIGGWARFGLCLAMPVLPVVLFGRHFRVQLAKRRDVARFVRASPAILFLLVFWALGELVGYIEASP